MGEQIEKWIEDNILIPYFNLKELEGKVVGELPAGTAPRGMCWQRLPAKLAGGAVVVFLLFSIGPSLVNLVGEMIMSFIFLLAMLTIIPAVISSMTGGRGMGGLGMMGIMNIMRSLVRVMSGALTALFKALGTSRQVALQVYFVEEKGTGRQRQITIKGDMKGGHLQRGHVINIKGFERQGVLTFFSGRNLTTGSKIKVKC